MATSNKTQGMLDNFASDPPDGVLRDFVNSDHRRVTFMVIVALCVFTSTLVFWMRMYTKLYIFRKTGWEDYFSLLAWLMYVGFCVPCLLVVQSIGWAHQWDILLKDLIKVVHYMNAAWIMYGIVIACVKLSLLLQYLKIFMPTRNYSFMVLVTYCVIWSTSVFYLITTFLEIFACHPREKSWNPLVTEGHCFNINAVNITSAAINCVSDFVILLLPQGVIWRLQMPLRTKLGISAIFLSGFFACITSIIRIYYAVKMLQTMDAIFNVLHLVIWSHAEITFGIVCGCLPVLPRLLLALKPKISMLFKSCVQTKPTSQGFRLSRSSRSCGDPGSSRYAGKGPYELQREWHSNEMYGSTLTGKRDSTITSSAAGTNFRSLEPTVGEPTAGLESMEKVLSANQILKTVHIETMQQDRYDPDLDIEVQRNAPAW